MKRLLKKMGTAVLLLSLGTFGVLHASGSNVETLKLIRTAMVSRVFIQHVAKDYLYAGNNVAVTKARKDMAIALKKFDAKQKKLTDSINDPKIENLMAFIEMNVEEIKDTIKKPYSLDNAAVVIDLAEAISEGEFKIAKFLRKKYNVKAALFKGARYQITEIAKYYIAYQSGLKDDVTVRQMNNSVEIFKSMLQGYKTNKNNNAKMNQIVNRMDKLWKIVHQFYLDIKEGGLPLIVYQTSDKIDQQIHAYIQEALKTKAARKGK